MLAKGEIQLRRDVHSLLETRKIYRRSRRNRKTRYRKPRFLNRKKPEGWLPPSVESRVQNTFHWIDRLRSCLPKVMLHLEVGKFDVAKMINPTVQGVDYQHGQTYGYYDVRYYVFARDNYTCQVCHQKGKVLHTHHILYKNMGGTDRADNLISVCTECHSSENHQPWHILWKWMKAHKKVPQYKAPTFMNVLRRRVFATYPKAVITYGSETTPRRKALGLPKTHANDAVAITGIKHIKKLCVRMSF
ncbi:RNA-guided endonuclease IscB [Terrilactibacillus sp. S3-3]|nr:RNA-guided endonuclease IscB [Terrilactibacillus sp. S3-3]